MELATNIGSQLAVIVIIVFAFVLFAGAIAGLANLFTTHSKKN